MPLQEPQPSPDSAAFPLDSSVSSEDSAADLPPTPWWDTGWQRRYSILIPGDKIASDVEGFPLLVVSSDADLIEVAAKEKLIVIWPETQTPLPMEIEWIGSSMGIWVKVPKLVVGQDTVLWLYGEPLPGTFAAPNAKEVWADFAAVWHFNFTQGVPAQALDSTVNSNHLTVGTNNNIDVPGKLGSSAHLDGVGDYLVRSGSLNQFDFSKGITLSAWIKGEDADPLNGDGGSTASFPSSGATILARSITYGSQAYDVLFRVYQGGVVVGLRGLDYNGTGPLLGVPSPQIVLESWIHLLATHGGGKTRIYRDGALLFESTAAGAIIAEGHPLYVGSFGDPSTDQAYPHQRLFEGQLDELRISPLPRSDAWVKLSYANQNRPELFAIVGDKEQQQP